MNTHKVSVPEKCPLCGKPTRLSLADKLRRGESRTVYYCPACDLGFLAETGSQEQLNAYYRRQYRKEYKPDISTQTAPAELFKTYSGFQSGRLSLISPFLGKKTRLLEIGCSAGMFLWHARKLVGEAVGMDFDSASAKYASRKCGCPVYTSAISETPLRKGSFDVICAFQTLEHVRDPLAFVREAGEYLKPGGVLFIEVPNLKDALVSSYDLPYHSQFYYHAAHLYYFSRRSLGTLLAKAGFTGQFHFTQDYNLVNHLNWVTNDLPQKNCLSGLSSPRFVFKRDVPAGARHRLDGFLEESDRAYKKLLSELGLTSNIAFVGRKTARGAQVTGAKK